MHAYCINLERRPDRRAEAESEFDREGLDVEFFHATDGKIHAPDGIRISKPEWGCADSHIRVWRDIVQNGHPYALVFEDDVQLLPNFNLKLKTILEELESLPTEWDYVNLGNIQWDIKYEQVTPSLFHGASWGAHAYIISNKCATHMAMWDAKDLKYGIDLQIARSPIYMLSVNEPIANQSSYPGGGASLLTSVEKGDIGFQRTADWDFLIRHFIQNIDVVVLFIILLCLLLIWRRN